MKLYMIERVCESGKKEYRSSGTTYQKWTRHGKCWTSGSFKGFLNYSKSNLEKMLIESCDYETLVLTIDLDYESITKTEFSLWVLENLK